MDHEGNGSPRWARKLVARWGGPEREQELVGDLEEAHRGRVRRHGRTVAALLTGLEAVDMAVAARLERRRLLGRQRRAVASDLSAARRRRNFRPPLPRPST